MKIITQGFLLSLLLISFIVNAQSPDVVRAQHMINQVDGGLSAIKRNDVATINGYTDKLKQAKELLEAETDKQNPAFREVAGQWMAVRDRLYATLDDWKNNTATAPATSSQPAAAAGASSADLYNQLITKYQSQNRPALAPDEDLASVKPWLNTMLSLYSTQWQQDNQTAEQWYASGKLNKNDYDRFNRWVNGTWHEQIGEQINQAYSGWNNALNGKLTEMDKFFVIADDDKNKVMNTAGGNNLHYNQDLIASSKGLLNILVEVESAIGKSQPSLRQQQKAVVDKAGQRLQQLMPLAEQYLAEWGKLPAKSNKNPTSQYLWLNGSRFAEITQKGEVWINSNFAGSFSSNGEIYEHGSYVGKMEADSKLYISSRNTSVTFEENGEVWVGGSHVGTIEQNGTVWGAGSAASVEGPGDWRRAAVVFFLQVFPRN